MNREEKFTVGIALGIIGFVLTVWLLFWGTVGTIVVHFVRKFW
jgi:hypothetical protein